MPLKLRDGKLVSHECTDQDDVLCLLQLQEQHPHSAQAVRLNPEDNALALQPWIRTLSRIDVTYPAYTDGRAHSQARLLRQRLGFAGEIRAVGDVRIDQISMMIRCGINAFECFDADTETGIASAQLCHLSALYNNRYQPEYPSVSTLLTDTVFQ